MLDKVLMKAIQDVVAEAGQPAAVSQRLIAWLTNMSDADPGVDDNTQFLTNVRKALASGDPDED